jgi:hypothetical protein
MTPPEFEQLIRDIVQSVLAQRESRATGYIATIASGYASGNPALKLPSEAAAGSKTERFVRPYDGITIMPSAGDVIRYDMDSNGKRVIAGKIDDMGSLFWVEPGDTQLLAADTERSTTNASFTTLKSFTPFRPGRYRVTYEAARTGGTASYQLLATMPDGSTLVVSTTNTLNGTTHPTYNAQTLNMNITVPPQTTISLQVKNDSAQTSYVQNARLKYQNATVLPASYNAVLLD